MINEILEKLNGKDIVILGFGKEGRSTYKFIRKYLGNVHLTIADKKDMSNDEVLSNDSNVRIIFGDKYLDNLEEFDLIIKSPGISLNYLDESYHEGIKDKITSQLELLLEVNRKNIIGITGTKGKSTTSSLLYNVIKDQGKDVLLAGNIGIPVLDEIESYKDDTILVVEMSSHQLEYVKCSPHIGIVLNLFQDHIDHAKTLEHYHENKMRMFKFQTNNDYALYSGDNEYTLKNLLKLTNSKCFNAIKYDIRFDDSEKIGFGTSVRIKDKNIYINDELVYKDKKRNLIGDHNLKNIEFVISVCHILNLDFNKAAETIYNFKPLEYRMEDLGVHSNIHFYCDTIATIPEATINATSSLKNIDTLIFGGENRNTDYTAFINYLNNSSIRNLICMYDTGELIKDKLYKDNKNIFFTRSMREAYQIALECTKPGSICILSPAASSKDVFKDFEEKGTLFKALVNNDPCDIYEHSKN